MIVPGGQYVSRLRKPDLSKNDRARGPIRTYPAYVSPIFPKTISPGRAVSFFREAWEASLSWDRASPDRSAKQIPDGLTGTVIIFAGAMPVFLEIGLAIALFRWSV